MPSLCNLHLTSVMSIDIMLPVSQMNLRLCSKKGHNDPSNADVTLHRPIADSFLCCLPAGCKNVCRCGVPPNVDEKEVTIARTHYCLHLDPHL